MSLLENPNEEELRILRGVFKIAEQVGNDYTYYNYWNYGHLQVLGVDLLKYSLSGQIIYDQYGNMTGGLAPDEALACAWDIWHGQSEIIPKIRSCRPVTMTNSIS